MRRSRVVTFAAIRLRGPGFKPRPGQKFEMRFLLHSHPSGGEGVSPVQGEAIRRRYIKPEYLSYLSQKQVAPNKATSLISHTAQFLVRSILQQEGFQCMIGQLPSVRYVQTLTSI